jgi:hypothetical protein
MTQPLTDKTVFLEYCIQNGRIELLDYKSSVSKEDFNRMYHEFATHTITVVQSNADGTVTKRVIPREDFEEMYKVCCNDSDTVENVLDKVIVSPFFGAHPLYVPNPS